MADACANKVLFWKAEENLMNGHIRETSNNIDGDNNNKNNNLTNVK